jgi:hypothetical protein
MRVVSTLVASALFLSGCSSETLYHWAKPGITQQQQDADWYQCTRENTTTGAEVSSLGGSTEVRQVQNTNMEMVVQCMKARGYTLTGVENR